MNTSRKDWSSIFDFMTEQDIIYFQTYYHRQRHCICKPLDPSIPLRLIEIEFKNNHCCINIHNTSDTTVEFLHGQEIAYFDARSKGLVQTNNSKHFPIDQYLHDRMTPATLCPSP